MRLQPEHIAAIKQATLQVLGAQATVRLFGSRLDDQAKGGDIDLFVETPSPQANRALAAAQLAASIERRLGEQRIDVVLVDPDTAPQPIHQIARAQGVLL
jgi:uncharacterized protein